MKIPMLVFVMLSYTLLASFIAGDVYGEESAGFPVLDLTVEFPDFNLTVQDANCTSIEGCIRYLANGITIIAEVIANVALSIFAVVRLIFELVFYVFELLGFLLNFLIGGIQGAPPYINLVIMSPVVIGAGIIIYRLIRSGASAD